MNKTSDGKRCLNINLRMIATRTNEHVLNAIQNGNEVHISHEKSLVFILSSILHQASSRTRCP